MQFSQNQFGDASSEHAGAGTSTVTCVGLHINVYGSRSFDKNSWWVTCGKMTIDVLWQKFFIVGGMI